MPWLKGGDPEVQNTGRGQPWHSCPVLMDLRICCLDCRKYQPWGDALNTQSFSVATHQTWDQRQKCQHSTSPIYSVSCFVFFLLPSSPAPSCHYFQSTEDILSPAPAHMLTCRLQGSLIPRFFQLLILPHQTSAPKAASLAPWCRLCSNLSWSSGHYVLWSSTSW